MAAVFPDKFDGDTPALLDAIREHIAADEDGEFIPNSIGGKARRMLNAAAARLSRDAADAKRYRLLRNAEAGALETPFIAYRNGHGFSQFVGEYADAAIDAAATGAK